MTRPRFALSYHESGLEAWHVRCLDELEDVADLIGAVRHRERPSNHFARRRIAGWYADHVQRARVIPIPDRIERLPDAHLDPSELEFVLKLGLHPIPSELVDSVAVDVWSFAHESEERRLPFLAEVYAGADVTPAALVAVAAGRETAVLVDGVFRTDKRSYAASRGRIEEAIASWPARACRFAAGKAFEAATAPQVSGEPTAGDVAPGRLVLRLAARRASIAWQRLFRHPQWNVGVLRRPAQTLLTRSAYTDDEVDWFPLEGRAGFLADPFGIVRGGRVSILCEYFDYRSSTGRIRSLEYSDRDFAKEAVDVLCPSNHISYPFLFEHAGQMFCIPETAADRQIALYRADDAGDGRTAWSQVAVLVAGFAGVDSTVFLHEDRWWLMCTQRGPQEDSELWIWHAPDVTGPWTSHELNPVKTDVRAARPGGMPFLHDGDLFRPAQDCSTTYGGRIILQRVTRLTPTEFAETPAAVVEAADSSRFPIGPHTLAAVGEVVLIDARRTVFIPAAFRAFLRILRGRTAGASRESDN